MKHAWCIYIRCIFPVNVINFFIMFARSKYFHVSLHSKQSSVKKKKKKKKFKKIKEEKRVLTKEVH